MSTPAAHHLRRDVDGAHGDAYDRPVSRTDRSSRVIAAPVHRVYAALVDREQLLAWLPPDGMTAVFERFDGRPGGSYRLVLSYDNSSDGQGKASADTDVVDARFVEMTPGARVVQAVKFESDDPRYAGTMTMSWDVEAVPEGTMVEITATGVPKGISAEDHAKGLASSLANLARFLERAGRLVRLGDGYAVSPAAYERARRLVVEECGAAGRIALARFRDLAGCGRRDAQLLLERLDADGVTRRVGQARVLRRRASASPSAPPARSPSGEPPSPAAR